MTIFIETDEIEIPQTPSEHIPTVRTEITRRKRPTRVDYDPAQEIDVIRLPVPSPGQSNPDIVTWDFVPKGGECWNYSYQPILLQLGNFRTPGDIAARYDIRVPPLSFFTWGWPDQYAKLQKIGYYVLGLHTGIGGVVTIIATKDRRPTQGGSLVEGLSTNFDVYEADVPADAAFHIVQFAEPAVSVEIDSLPSGPNPANTAQMLAVQVTSDPNGLTSGNGNPNWETAFTLPQGAAAGLGGGSKAYNGLVTAMNVKDLGAAVGRYSIQVLT